MIRNYKRTDMKWFVLHKRVTFPIIMIYDDVYDDVIEEPLYLTTAF